MILHPIKIALQNFVRIPWINPRYVFLLMVKKPAAKKSGPGSFLTLDDAADLYHQAEFGRLAFGIFHDLMKPLQAVATSVDACAESFQKQHIKQAQESVIQAVAISRTLTELLATIRLEMAPQSDVECFCPIQCIRNIVRMMSFCATQAHVSIAILARKASPIAGNPHAFYQIMSNLLSNAIEASSCFSDCHRRRIIIKINRCANSVVIRVTDRGCGISPEIVPRIFDPYFSTKEHRHGMGLGLATTKHLVEKNFQGTIHYEPHLPYGTTFIVRIPTQNRPVDNHSPIVAG